jgi:hypothetical protein
MSIPINTPSSNELDNISKFLTKAGYDKCKNPTKLTSDPCLYQIMDTNCNSSKSLASTLFTETIQGHEDRAAIIQKTWNNFWGNDQGYPKNREELGKFLGSLNKNAICFANEYNSKVDKGDKLVVPDSNLLKGLEEGSNTDSKLLASIILSLSVLLIIIVNMLVKNHMISSVSAFLILVIAVTLIYML